MRLRKYETVNCKNRTKPTHWFKIRDFYWLLLDFLHFFPLFRIFVIFVAISVVDSYVFGYVIILYGSGSFYHQAKIKNKSLLDAVNVP
jgi:hypothetical protein